MKVDLSTFVKIADDRKGAYRSHIEYEKSFNDEDNPYLKMNYEEFCTELDKGYGNSSWLQIARLYEDEDGKVWYDNEYIGDS